MAEYLYRTRPPGLGCQPNGWIEREAWHPSREHEAGSEEQYFWGHVTYAGPLTFPEIDRYELWPVSLTERAQYAFWGKGDDAEWLYESYMAADADLLREHVQRGDTLAKAALVLKGEIK